MRTHDKPKQAVGVDLGGTSIRAALVSAEGVVMARSSAVVRDRNDGAAILDDLTGLVSAVLPRSGVSSVGIGAAGPLDHLEGRMYSPPNLPGLSGVALGPLAGSRLGLPVFLENDANAAAFGEYCAGIGAGTSVFLALTLGTGVGGGVVIDGALFRGPDGCAAELGHVTVDPSGPRCGCGSTGCLEVYASSTAVAARFATQIESGRFPPPRGLSKPPCDADSSEVFAFARAGDPGATKALAEAGRMLGIGISSLVNVFNPDAIALLGGLAGAFEFLREPVAEAVSARCFSPAKERVKIAPGLVGKDAGVVGAAMLALARSGENDSM